jgi:hypothetical protein
MGELMGKRFATIRRGILRSILNLKREPMTTSEEKAREYATDILNTLKLGRDSFTISPDLFSMALQLAYKSGFIQGELEIMMSYHGIKENEDEQVRPNQ